MKIAGAGINQKQVAALSTAGWRALKTVSSVRIGTGTRTSDHG